MPIDFDESRPPLLYITYKDAIENDQISTVVATLRRWTDRGRPFGVVVDTL